MILVCISPIVILNIFSYAHCHLYVLFRELSLQVLTHFFNWIVYFLLLSFENSLYVLDSSTWEMYGLQLISPSLFAFHPLNSFFYRANIFNFDEVLFNNCFVVRVKCVGCCYEVISESLRPHGL